MELSKAVQFHSTGVYHGPTEDILEFKLLKSSPCTIFETCIDAQYMFKDGGRKVEGLVTIAVFPSTNIGLEVFKAYYKGGYGFFTQQDWSEV